MSRENVAREPINEADAILAAQAGDLGAFNLLVVTYQNLAYSVAFRLLNDDVSAADAVQDSFIKAYRALHQFQGGNFKSWLMRIVTNTCYDELRSRKRRPHASLDDLPVEQEPENTLSATPDSPETHVDRLELAAAIELGIAALPDDQRMALVLCDVQGYAYEEISEITGWPMGTVKSRISRARNKLRDHLLQHPELLPSDFRPKDV